MQDLSTHPVILFDGVCNFCNGVVNFLIRRDRAGKFRFAPLQSAIGQELMRRHHLDPTNLDSIVMIDGTGAYKASTAVLKIMSSFPGAWKLMRVFLVLPLFLRDGAYRLMSRNRYRWFGKKDQCMIPTPEVRGRFLS